MTNTTRRMILAAAAGVPAGLALGGAAAGVLLGLAGYVSGGQAQPASALAAIPLLFATGPALMLACSAPLLFKLDRLRRGPGHPHYPAGRDRDRKPASLTAASGRSSLAGASP